MSPQHFCSAQLIERISVTDDLAVFKFKPSEKLSFMAGQYATLGIEVKGRLCERPYSIVSSPREQTLEFFIELVQGGVLSPLLWELKTGSRIWIRHRIVGQLTLRSAWKRHLMLATVTGIAPFVSIVRTKSIEDQDQQSDSHRLLIIHGASHSADFGPYREELSSMSNAGWITYVPTVSRPWDEPAWRGETGRIEDVVRKHADACGFLASNSFAYTCGHPSMITNVKEILKRASFSTDQVQEEEYFGPAKAIRPIHSGLVDDIRSHPVEAESALQLQAENRPR